MQRQIEDGIIIACDFCGTDWDQVSPMVEGHRGAVICLACAKLALAGENTSPDDFTCTLCLGPQTAGEGWWRSDDPPAAANADAAVCASCIQQVAEAFDKDRSVDFSIDEN